MKLTPTIDVSETVATSLAEPVQVAGFHILPEGGVTPSGRVRATEEMMAQLLHQKHFQGPVW